MDDFKSGGEMIRTIRQQPSKEATSLKWQLCDF